MRTESEIKFFEAVEKVNYPISSRLDFRPAIESKMKLKANEIVIPSIKELKLFYPANKNFKGFSDFIKVKANSEEANFYADWENKYGKHFNSHIYTENLTALLFSFEGEIAFNLASNLATPLSKESENYLNRLLRKAEMNILSLDEQVQFHSLHNYAEHNDKRVSELISSARIPKGILHLLIKCLKELLLTQKAYTENEAKQLALKGETGSINGYADINGKKFEDLFKDKLYAKSCVEVLKKVSPPVINELDEYCLGRSSKSAMVAFYDALKEKGKVEKDSDNNLAAIFNQRFPKLNLDPTGRIFRDGHRAAYRKYKEQLKALLK